MTPERWKKVSQILDEVFGLQPEKQAEALDELCDDAEIYEEVVALLDAESEAPGFLDREVADLNLPFVDESPPTVAEPGARIGAYRLIEEIGRGGMGVVFLAERADGEYERQVALKVLPRSFETDERIERFRAERQILASLDHPGIAQMLDGGVTDAGRPFLVMEHVEGVPIAEYCHIHDSSIGERLHLLRSVCRAVQHAHRRLVVHRDLKPSNILVTETADGPQVKLLDFGIAKLLDENPGWTVPRTRTGEHLMTPQYAAPEQIRGDDITTATDVYQLGVLAYELLTGQRPFSVDDRSLSEIERVVLETTPQKPSTFVRGLDEEAAAETLPHSSVEWGEQLRGDLDTIVLKALRKEPARRYESVKALEQDIRRYQHGQPVEARPATLGYRARKFVSRHRWGVATMTFVAILIVGFGAMLISERNRAQQKAQEAQREAAKAQRVSGFLVDLFETSQPSESLGDTVTARELLERGAEQAETLGDQPEVQAQMLASIGQAYEGLGRYDEAQPLLEEALSTRRATLGPRHPEVAQTLHALAVLAFRKREYRAADSLFERSLEMRRALHEEPHPEIAESLNDLAVVRRNRGQLASADTLYQQALSMRRSLFGSESSEVISTLNNLAVLKTNRGAVEEAEALYREVLASRRKKLGETHPRVANTLNNLATCLRRQGKLAEAESTYRETLAMRRQLLDADHPKIAQSLNNLANVLRERGALSEAEPLYRQALDIRREQFGEEHITVANSLNNLAHVLRNRGQYDEAEQMQRRAVSIYRSELGDQHRYVGVALDNLAELLRMRGGCGEALDTYREAWEVLNASSSSRSTRAETGANYGACLAEQGQPVEAEPLLRQSYSVLRKQDSTQAADARRALVEVYEDLGQSDSATVYRERRP